jgi:hypothetical protein
MTDNYKIMRSSTPIENFIHFFLISLMLILLTCGTAIYGAVSRNHDNTRISSVGTQGIDNNQC